MRTSKAFFSAMMALALFAMPLNELAQASCSGGTASATCSRFQSCTRSVRDLHGREVSACNRRYSIESAACFAAHGEDDTKLAECLANISVPYFRCIRRANKDRNLQLKNCCANNDPAFCWDYSEPCPGYVSQCY